MRNSSLPLSLRLNNARYDGGPTSYHLFGPVSQKGPTAAPSFIVYTDAATKSNTMAAMAIHHDGTKPRIFQLLVSHVPKFWRRRFHSKNEIMGSETLAPIAFLWANRPYIRGKRINLYIDNNTASNAIIRGGMCKPHASRNGLCLLGTYRILFGRHLDR